MKQELSDPSRPDRRRCGQPGTPSLLLGAGVISQGGGVASADVLSIGACVDVATAQKLIIEDSANTAQTKLRRA
jgi:hypothetical protein